MEHALSDLMDAHTALERRFDMERDRRLFEDANARYGLG